MNSKDEYSIGGAKWPNGGNLDFNNCVVEQNKRAECSDQDGNRYYIDVDSSPDQPEDDYSSSDY